YYVQKHPLNQNILTYIKSFEIMKIPIYHTMTMPSGQLSRYLSELSVIAAYAKAAGQIQLYEQAKSAYDNMVSQYNEQTKPKKKGFWDLPSFWNLNTNDAMPLSYLEEDTLFKILTKTVMTLTQGEIIKKLNESVELFNQKYGS
ncbi:MAG: hypothetical protein II495_06675, partial [Paludibacteraceae bacterium]|nr:hypothetical protein [Paludibacteraceae bacterium]